MARGAGLARGGIVIDKTFYALNLTVYYRDLLGSLTVSIAGVAWCLNASGLLFVVAFVLTVAAMHRAAFFIHELTHQKDNPRLRTFSWFWDLTVGAFFLSRFGWAGQRMLAVIRFSEAFRGRCHGGQISLECDDGAASGTGGSGW